MTTFLKSTISAALIFLATTAHAQDAISVDPDGTVTIPGQLNAGSVQADNLDQALADLKTQIATAQSDITAELKKDIAALSAQITQQTSDQSWFVYDDTFSGALAKVTDADILAYEFGAVVDKGFRKTNFVSRVGGLFLMSEPYVTDIGSPGVYSFAGPLFFTGKVTMKIRVGGQTVTISATCDGDTSGKLVYKYASGIIWSPGFSIDCQRRGKLYARKRQFK